MPRRSEGYVPKLRKAPRGSRSRVTLGGRDFYLGEYGSSETAAEYHRLVAQWEAAGRPTSGFDPDAENPKSEVLVELLVVEYARHLKAKYPDQPNGTPHRDYHKPAKRLKVLRGLFGKLPINEFGPKCLKEYREAFLDEGVSRRYANECVNFIRYLFKWAIEQELLTDWTVYERLTCVQGLKRGERADVREKPPIEPVADDVVDKTLPYLPAIVADIIQVQRLTGARCQEICDLRLVDIDRSDDVWLFRPVRHKSSNRGKDRVILIGPKAQVILASYLRRSETAYVFDPREQIELTRKEAIMNATCHRNKPRGSKANPDWKPGSRYTTEVVRRAVHRACDKAFPAPDGIEGSELESWRKSHRWSPHRLRHAAATEVRRIAGLDSAQLILGHSEARTTERYAELDISAAIEIIRKIG